MRLERIVVTSLVAIAATGIASVTANSEPTPTPRDSRHSETPRSIHGTDHDIGFTTGFTSGRDGVVTTLEAGRFDLAVSKESVDLIGRDGLPFATVPLTVHAANRQVALRPTIEDQGRKLTLHPVDLSPGELRAIDEHQPTAEERWNAEVQRASFGAMVGGGIGLVIGLALGGLILFPIPIATTAIGAGIGFLAVGGQPLIDAGIAYFSGQPAPPPAAPPAP
ncbi:hypothetical protein [Nocardia thraciensis]